MPELKKGMLLYNQISQNVQNIRILGRAFISLLLKSRRVTLQRSAPIKPAISDCRIQRRDMASLISSALKTLKD